MSHGITRRTLAVLVAIAVVCSVAGAPLATVAADGDVPETIGDDDQEEDGQSDDGDDGDGTDSTGDDSDGDTEESTEDSGDSTDSDGDTDNDTAPGNDGEDADTDTEAGADGRDTLSETIDDTVSDTIDSAGNAVESADGSVSETSQTAIGFAESTTDIGEEDDDIGPMVPIGQLDEGDALEEPETALSTERESSTGDPATGSLETAAEGDTDGEPAEEVAMSTGGGGHPIPTAPVGGALVGVGALAAAAVLRSTPIVASNGVSAVDPSWSLSSLLDRIPPVLFPLRYSRYDDSDPLEHDAREEVYEVVNLTPGSYLSEVSEEADLPLSTTRHHIKVLEREGLVSGAKLRGKRRFYPAYAEGIELAAALNDESTAGIIDAINRLGAASVSDLASDLERDPSTISHHLQRLEEDGIIRREREGRAVMNKLSSEARTALEPETTPKPGRPREAMAGGAD